ncbi:type II toxin-antitoxin system VapC family toxin [Duganella aceris]|uniref:Type II toxin-antitoxin system VapC family toxin n=1 Tax=Duganella aceris TaxID=2703883 RepID=A0ABX0FJ27_9BURK|nr:type II toxin-antitoxin system VapC family toxin [Duganella aceris]NGZ84484.1 type II toxin-antitoxin system VapC family toxin [Duganella aceris]
MIGLDTNVLARYYIDDSTDAEAKRQRPAAQRLIDSGQPLSVCKTVIVELEWLMRADALHHASYQHCDSMASFDERKFAHRVAVMKLHPPVDVPQ